MTIVRYSAGFRKTGAPSWHTKGPSSSKWVRSKAVEEKKSGPVLRGPTISRNSTWRRKVTPRPVSSSWCRTTSTATSSGSANEVTSDSSHTTESHTGDMGWSTDLSSRPPVPLVFEAPTTKSVPLKPKPAIATTQKVMKKRGSHKLILNIRPKGLPGALDTELFAESSNSTGTTLASTGTTLTKRGAHKLVLADKVKKKKPTQRRKRPRAEPVVKRVQIANISPNDSSDESDSEKNKKTLTDFSYRETKQPASRWGRPNKKRNMGLVRVQPNTEKTPICITYLRGLACTNPKCQKRHDVPKEAAVPICSFFQFNGQCNKGEECPFRHIKVNPRATVCPCFQLLGFCEDKNCVMKHERSSKKKHGDNEDVVF